MRPIKTFPMPDGDKLYRVTAQRYSVTLDAELELYGTSAPELQLHAYLVNKRTRCGAWITTWAGDTKFVNLQANKRYACNTPEEAIESFIARKKRQIRILSTQCKYAEEEKLCAERVRDAQ